MITYSINTLKLEQLKNFIKKIDDYFIPPLSERVNLTEYSNKIYKNATLFEAWDNDTLIGLIACYANNLKTKVAFFSLVAVLKEYRQQGIAGTLIENCVVKLKNMAGGG